MPGLAPNVGVDGSLRDYQKHSLVKLLNLNPEQTEDTGIGGSKGKFTVPAQVNGADGEKPVWKVLVFDRLGADVISSVLRKNDLRDNGVTVHMNINAERYPISDVPAIYFIEPTIENANTVDLAKGMYSSAYVNFSSSVPRDLLETFAMKTFEGGVSNMVSQVYDQYLNFIVSEPELFSLGLPDVYRVLNDPAMEHLIEPTIAKIVSGLFSVIVTMGVLPILRCPRGGAAEMVTQKLDAKLKDHLHNSRNNLFRNSHSVSQRPIMIILDRTVDLIPMFSHSWTYQSLAHDVLNLRRNQLTVETVEHGKTKKQNYDLDSKDFFWSANSNSPFPQVAENIDVELNRYREDAASIVNKTGVNNIEDLNQEDLGNNAGHLSWAIGLLPELSARKAVIDLHFNILTTLLPIIKQRQLDNFFQMEESITRQSKTQLLEAINDPAKNDAEDKLRLFIIWYLSVEDVSASDMNQYERALINAGCDLAPLNYVKRVRELTRLTMMASAPAQPSGFSQTGGDFLKGFSSLSSRVTDRFREAGIGGQLENLLSGIKSLIPSSKDLTVSKIVESLSDASSSAASNKTDDYLIFDPRSPSTSQTRSNAGPPRQNFSEAIVFTIGGGNYYEYGNLIDWSSRQASAGQKKRVIYGSTELLSPHNFIEELGKIPS